MAASVYLEQYLDGLANLPSELRRNFELMRDLDSRAQNNIRSVDTKVVGYLTGVREMETVEQVGELSVIKELFSKCKQHGEDKVQLAIQTYEMVDKHIRHLDNDLARFEAEVKELISQNSDEESDSPLKKKKSGMKRKSGANGGASSNGGSGKKAKKNNTDSTPSSSSSMALANFSPTTDVLDMPVDPNEPTYCLCHQVSYGEMVGCDNQDCPIEWFHFGCVGLTAKPKGKWFCPRCAEERKKK